jgi:hypothetical protein
VLSGRSLAALLLLASACGTSPQTTQLREAVAAQGAGSPAKAVAFRFATQRGADARLYNLPGLEEVSWRFDTPGLVADRVLGFADDDDLVYVLTRAGTVAALDLNSGHARILDSSVVRAAATTEGRVVLIRADGTIASLEGRRATPLGHLPKGATAAGLWGATGDGALVALKDTGGRAIRAVAGGALAPPHRVPNGSLAVGPWGDLAAVATDSGLVVIDLERGTANRRVRVEGAPTAIAFSASGHRIFVATAKPALVIVDRFELRALDDIPLPAPVTALRAEPFGHYLFGQTANGLIAISESDHAVRRMAGTWAPDLPAAAPDGTILVRQGTDVVALGARDLALRGRVRDASRDQWLVAEWDPRRPALQLAAGASPGAATTTSTDQDIFVQVSSTSNPQWAEDLARDLRLAGMKASVLPPQLQDEMYRVVIGPYGSRDEAEAIGRKLGMPYWIFTRTAPEGGQ